ncbi:eukaryotic translation initiation factor 3 subunit M [Hibiscus syriacus]|uniref:Eukaryotic translation initiation factor 3 subunit M n=1 Tax=Hibiscus syriacus TaxID=106335 RepID=A0A6A2ZQU6_HIBSY|nr:eukaryotic translation initiation factor 3 subunit M [Hibiscus syriacus]
MSGDWGPVVVAVVLFLLCTPGLLCQLPGNKRAVGFANFETSPISIFVHTIIFFGLVTIFVIAIDIHVSSG